MKFKIKKAIIMFINKDEIYKYFKDPNEKIRSGGNRSSFNIVNIGEQTIRIQPINGKVRTIKYDYLSIVVNNFEHCEDGKMVAFVTRVLGENGRNVEGKGIGRTYLYGIAREYLKRKQKNTLPTFEEISHKFENAVEEAKRRSSEERKARLKTASRTPTSSTSTITVFNRNPDVVAEVLERANGVCETCGNDAPFKRTKDGTPFLEVHHKIRLADNGDDTVKNAVALCPNCHRKQHYGITK